MKQRALAKGRVVHLQPVCVCIRNAEECVCPYERSLFPVVDHAVDARAVSIFVIGAVANRANGAASRVNPQEKHRVVPVADSVPPGDKSPAPRCLLLRRVLQQLSLPRLQAVRRACKIRAGV